MLNFNGLPSFDDQTHPASFFNYDWVISEVLDLHSSRGLKKKMTKKAAFKMFDNDTMVKNLTACIQLAECTAAVRVRCKQMKHIHAAAAPPASLSSSPSSSFAADATSSKHATSVYAARRRRRMCRHAEWISWKKHCCDGFVFAIVALKAGKNGHGWCFCCKFLHLKVSFVNCLCERCILMLQKRSAIETWNFFYIYS